MESISVKIKRTIKEGIRDCKDFGPEIAMAKLKCIWTNESLDAVKEKNEKVLRYLERTYAELIEKYKDAVESEIDDNKARTAPVWVLWWHGEENMPEIIRLCHLSRRWAAKDHPVILLSQDNIREYIEFPDEVWNQFNAGTLKIQHLADMIRVQLIKKYGGIWLDASIFCGKQMEDFMFERALFSVKGKEDEYFVSNNQWKTFVIGGFANNVLCSFLDEFFIEYCGRGKRFVDYFMFDCAIALAYKNIPAVTQSIDMLEKSSDDVYWLDTNLEQCCDEIFLKTLDVNLVSFNKIAWNKPLQEKIRAEQGMRCLIQYLNMGK